VNIKNEVEEFLRLYAHLTGSTIRESEDIIYLELSPLEKRKHLLSQLKFSFSKELCELENAELLTSTNPTYQALLAEAKDVGVVAVARSYQVDEPVLVVAYRVTMTCQNHLKEDIRELCFRISDCSRVPALEFWSEADPSDAADIVVDTGELSERLREGIIEDIAEIQFRFNDEMDRRQDRERMMVQGYYEQRRQERMSAPRVLEDEIAGLDRKMETTNSMKVYNSCKGQIEKLRTKIVSLENSMARDMKKISDEHETAMRRIKERFAVETQIDLLNALIVLPTPE